MPSDPPLDEPRRGCGRSRLRPHGPPIRRSGLRRGRSASGRAGRGSPERRTCHQPLQAVVRHPSSRAPDVYSRTVLDGSTLDRRARSSFERSRLARRRFASSQLVVAVAQLARAPGCGPGGRGFEPLGHPTARRGARRSAPTRRHVDGPDQLLERRGAGVGELPVVAHVQRPTLDPDQRRIGQGEQRQRVVETDPAARQRDPGARQARLPRLDLGRRTGAAASRPAELRFVEPHSRRSRRAARRAPGRRRPGRAPPPEGPGRSCARAAGASSDASPFPAGRP